MTKQQRDMRRKLCELTSKRANHTDVIKMSDMVLEALDALDAADAQIESLQTTIRVMQDRLIAAQSR